LCYDVTKENNAFEASIASPERIDKNKSKLVDEVTIKKFEKGNKIVRGHLLNHMTNPLFNLFIIFKSAKII